MAQLRSLTLNFQWCKAFEDLAGLEGLGGLKALQECKLNSWGPQMDAGLGGLEHLWSLELNFVVCQALEDAAGLEALGGLKALQDCKLNFWGTGIRDL
eukprot:8749728-Heterocapsa_arctica.AAC.1